MAFLAVLFATVSVTQLGVTAATGCRSVPIVPEDLNTVFEYGKLHNETASTLNECVEKCRSFPACKTFSFNREEEGCHIQLMEGPYHEVTSPSKGIYSSTMNPWKKVRMFSKSFLHSIVFS